MSGSFKGIIAFALIVEYEEGNEENMLFHFKCLLFIRNLFSMYAKTMIYGLVIFSTLIWGAVFPLIINCLS